MHLRPLAVVSLVAVFVMTGCSPAPEVSPSPWASSTPTPTPTVEPILAPVAAFDVTCAEVDSVTTGLLGESLGGVSETMGLTSSPNWYPGPAQYMMQRAGGIACSAGDPARFDSQSQDTYWSVAMVPDAQMILDGAASRGAAGNVDIVVRCYEGGCMFTLRDGDVLLTGALTAPDLVEGDQDRVREAMEGLLATAAGTLRDFEYGASEIAAARCETMLTGEEVSALVGTHVEIVEFTTLGVWGIPAEVYYVNGGGQYCMYAEGSDIYHDATLVTLTTLPSGAWAFEELDGGSPVSIEGADTALSGTDFYGRSVLDVRVGADWLRFTTSEGEDASTMTSIATMAVEHLTRGRPAPQ
ncbi:hypothetical protein [Microbacterium sp. NPDC091662]|uniref:hypothetical protein n=1 Tax=Microbacterium sp. NPDC091662 TaxID=3364211 RepID=UPI00381F0CCF